MVHTHLCTCCNASLHQSCSAVSACSADTTSGMLLWPKQRAMIGSLLLKLLLATFADGWACAALSKSVSRLFTHARSAAAGPACCSRCLTWLRWVEGM